MKWYLAIVHRQFGSRTLYFRILQSDINVNGQQILFVVRKFCLKFLCFWYDVKKQIEVNFIQAWPGWTVQPKELNQLPSGFPVKETQNWSGCQSWHF